MLVACLLIFTLLHPGLELLIPACAGIELGLLLKPEHLSPYRIAHVA